jgi:ABC-type cobalamin/Fe3+-siderophores transport system ATPase subunit
MTPLLTAQNLTFGYGDRPVLHDVSLELHKSQVVALIGPNGSGKSTLIKLLCGHLHGTGQITLDGTPLPKWRKRMLARRLAYLPQSPTYEPSDRVADVLRLGRAPYWTAFGVESEHDLTTVTRIAQLLELGELLDRRMDELSGGQRQRVFVGRCLVQEPAVLLLDEPNSFLDLRHQVDLLKLLQKLAHECELSVLMASHDLNLAGAFSDQLLLVSNGALIARGTAQQVLQPSIIEQAYGLPMIELTSPTHRMLIPKL